MDDPDGDLLAPLSVDDGGVAVAPRPAARARRPHGARWRARAVLEFVRATAAEGTEVRTQPPWTTLPAATSPAPSLFTPRFGSSFTRMLDLDPASLRALPDWWRRGARDERVRVTRRLSLEEPRREGAGMWRMRGRLRSPWGLRAIPVELSLWSHLGYWTKLSLEPQRQVHVSRRYFAKGHRVLDRLTAQLATR